MNDPKWYHVVIGLILAVIFTAFSAGAFAGLAIFGIFVWALIKGVCALIVWIGASPSRDSSPSCTPPASPESLDRP